MKTIKYIHTNGGTTDLGVSYVDYRGKTIQGPVETHGSDILRSDLNSYWLDDAVFAKDIYGDSDLINITYSEPEYESDPPPPGGSMFCAKRQSIVIRKAPGSPLTEKEWEARVDIYKDYCNYYTGRSSISPTSPEDIAFEVILPNIKKIFYLERNVC